ncbi:hypothetical protein CELL_03201 [Cellulomonas sp. T2.31MG-18]
MTGHAPVALDVDAYVGSYVPIGIAHWPDVTEFVRSAASEFFQITPPSTRGEAQAAMREIARLADFQFARTGRVSTKTVFTRVTVAQLDASRAGALRASANGAAKAARDSIVSDGEVTLASQLSRIVRIGRALNPAGGWDPKPPSRPRRVTPPYSPDELRRLEEAVARNSGLPAVNGEAVLVLGLGAGLSGTDLLVRTTQCEDLGDKGIVIEVAGRRVPVLERYESRLRALLASTAPGNLLIGSEATHKNAVNEAVARVQIPQGAPALEPGRLRATWIVSHLASGVRVPELMRAAGLVSMTSISDLARFVPALDDDRATAMLRQSGQRR